jgi:hypothetical protein
LSSSRTSRALALVAAALLCAAGAVTAEELAPGTWTGAEGALELRADGTGWARWRGARAEPYAVHPVAGRLDGAAFVGTWGALRWAREVRVEPAPGGHVRLRDRDGAVLLARRGGTSGEHPWLGSVLRPAAAAGDLARVASETWLSWGRDLVRVRVTSDAQRVVASEMRVEPDGQARLVESAWSLDGRLARLVEGTGDADDPREHTLDVATPRAPALGGGLLVRPRGGVEREAAWEDVATPVELGLWLLPALARHLPDEGVVCVPTTGASTLASAVWRLRAAGSDGARLVLGDDAELSELAIAARDDADGRRVVSVASGRRGLARAVGAAEARAWLDARPGADEVRRRRDVESAVSRLRLLADVLGTHAPASLEQALERLGAAAREPAARLRGYRLEYAALDGRWIAIARPDAPGRPPLAIGGDGLLRVAQEATPLDPAELAPLRAYEPE